MDFDLEDVSLVTEDDFYGFLNISRDATPEQVTNAYRRLSRIYHPDKHQDITLKKKAEHLFNKTKKAYEVLSNPHTRAIYDNLGVKGLETEGWQLIERTRSPEEIRAEYERLVKEREERRLQQRTNPRGNVTLSVNASELFNKQEEYDYDEFDDTSVSLLSKIEVSGMSFNQSVEMPLTIKDTATISGNLSSSNGNGAGSVNLACRHVISEKSHVEVEFGCGNGPLLGLKGFRTLTRQIFCNAGVHIQITDLGIRPGYFSTLAMQMDKNTVGYLTYRGSGKQSSLATSVIQNTENYMFSFNILIGLPHSYITTSYTRKMLHRQLNFKLSLKIGTFGGIIEYGAEKKLSQHNTLSATVALGVPTGVSLKIRFLRANQTYSFPIQLCDDISLAPVFYATVAPLVVYNVVKKLIVEPHMKEQQEREKNKQKEANKEKIIEMRKDAMAIVELMKATYERIRNEESNRSGLVIVKAVYGNLELSNNSSDNIDNDMCIDVTIPLQCLVKDGRLVLHNSSKSQLPGFYDPAIGEDKSLLVEYTFHDELHRIKIDDTDALRIPQKSHCVSEVN